jgi:hypothetical protein
LISWRKELRIDPVPGLLSSGNIAIKYFTLHDLCDRADGSVETLWNLPEVKKILKNRKTMVHGVIQVKGLFNIRIMINTRPTYI